MMPVFSIQSSSLCVCLQAIGFYTRGPVNAFFGPVCDYAAAPVARQSRYWNIPTLTAGAMSQEFRNSRERYNPLLTRVGPTFTSLSAFMLDTLRSVFRIKPIINSAFRRGTNRVADGQRFARR